MSNSSESGLAGGLESDYSGGEGVAVGLLRAFRWAEIFVVDTWRARMEAD